jgi:hypothetical protein
MKFTQLAPKKHKLQLIPPIAEELTGGVNPPRQSFNTYNQAGKAWHGAFQEVSIVCKGKQHMGLG